MARLDNKGKYVPNKGIKVSQLTIDSMKREGMKRALERANSGQESEEFVEGARRMYGRRVTGAAKKMESPTVTKTAEQGHVIGEAKANTLSKRAPQKRLET